MPKQGASLNDKYDLGVERQLLTGTQAIVRLLLMQHARDANSGLKTAGYVSGYRGSPIAALESALIRTRPLLDGANVVFHPGVNEDLAATAIWGTQMAELRGEGRYDGVFGVWYGKGPGVDRSGDVFRHANHAGTSKNGGVIALMGDDHTCESSTSAHQSEFAFVDAMMPVLNPAGVQEILDYGLYGFALSRYAGVWVGIKCVKDNIESTATVDGRIDRVSIKLPTADEFPLPSDGLNIRLGDQALTKEARLHDYKRGAALAFARVNKLDRIVMSGGVGARIGIVSTGKSYLDTRQALDELGIDELKANQLGIRLYKVAMTYPMEPEGLRAFAEGLDLIIVVEEKRALIEVQVKEELFNLPNRPIVLGKKDENDQWLFPAKGALDPLDIALSLGERIARLTSDEGVRNRLGELKRLKGNMPATADAFQRTPYFCAGCPHNSSTVVPEGSRAYAGIGCHYMAQWMDRQTEGFTHMGGEGANWVGEAHFSKRKHVFQNLGDGTYIHSGSLALRAAVGSGVNVTYKILYNDAVAMTGGQKLDGGMTVTQVVGQALAEGVKRVDVVTDQPENYTQGMLPPGVRVHHRRDLQAVQKELAEIPGTTVLVYDQTCAAEKRRRRKKGEFPDPDKRIFINPAVCEGCGDCGVKSNCVAVIPLETELGRKRQIDQSACNKDFSCVEGFCPSFVSVHGAKPKKAKGVAGQDGITAMLASLPDPSAPALGLHPYSMLVTGVGGTGVVTVSAVLAQAAHIEGKGFGSIDMTGLAQKGGAVACHMRVATDPSGIHAIRIGSNTADVIIGGDLVVTAGNKILETVKPDHTAVVFNTYEMTTGDFTRKPDLQVPGGALAQAIADRVRKGTSVGLDAHDYAVRLFGDSIASNMFLLGLAYQLGLIPIGAVAIEEAITLNGAAVDMNRQAFRFGRLAAHDRAALDRIAKPVAKEKPVPKTLDEIVAFRAGELAAYQDEALAQRFKSMVASIANIEHTKAPGKAGLAEAVAHGYHKLLAYKDEYEVARLYTDGRFQAAIADKFDGSGKIEFHLSPPIIGWLNRDKVTGHPRKVTLGPWMMPVLRMLARMKGLRGSWLDVFGYARERRMERQMIADYERRIDEITQRLTGGNHAAAVALALLPLEIKGFGHVKLKNADAAKVKEIGLLARLRSSSPTPVREAAE